MNTIKLVSNGRIIRVLMPNGEFLNYVTSVNVKSEAGNLVRVDITCLSLEEKLIEGEIPVYTVTINADPSKIDTDKLIWKFKNNHLISP